MNMNGQTMTQKIKHADVLIAIAEGKYIQCKPQDAKDWIMAINLSEVNPLTYPEYEWRIKPEPKSDIDVHLVWDDVRKGVALRLTENFLEDWKRAIKLTFDAETNEYKSTEVIK